MQSIFGLALAAVLLFANGAGAAEMVKSNLKDRKDAAVTVYNTSLGLVREIRTVNFPTGEVGLEFEGVPAKVDPTSVSFQAEGVRVLEQNYEFDLLSRQKLLDKFVGREVEIVRTEMVKDQPKEISVKAKLLANNQGPIYLIDDRIHLDFPGRVVLSEISTSLRARPTLVYLLNAETPGTRDVTVTYQTGGMSWSCDYVAIISPDDSRLILLTGWVTLNNQSGGTFENAQLKLIAGDVHRAEPPLAGHVLFMKNMAGGEESDQSFTTKKFFEYHLYTLQRRTTLTDNSTKQVELLTASNIPVKKILTVEHGSDDVWGWWTQPRSDERKEKVKVVLEFLNDDTSHLGMPLPKGRVRVNKEDSDGSLQFVGEDEIDHTPKNEPLRLLLGNSFDITATRRQKMYDVVQTTPRQMVKEEFEIEIRNHKSEDIEVHVLERLPEFQEVAILKSSHPYNKRSAYNYEFTVPVKANETATLTYTARAEF